MQILVSKFSAAAHLALLAVAPLLVSAWPVWQRPFVAILWFSLFALIWLLMSPSCFRDERPSQARSRVARAILADPLTWFLLLVILHSAVLCLNSGVQLRYDAEAMKWFLAAPKIACLPGSTEFVRWEPLIMALAAFAAVIGIRHSLGKDARTFFCIVASFLSALIALVLLVVGFEDGFRFHSVDYSSSNDAQFIGFAFGVWLLISIIALFACVKRFKARVLIVSGTAVVGNLVGLAAFSYPLMAFSFLFAAIGMMAAFMIFKGREIKSSRRMTPVFLFLLALSVAVGIVFMAGDKSILYTKWAQVFSVSPFPEHFFAIRRMLSEACCDAWKDHPWIGVGLGSMRYIIRFYLSEAAWTLVPNSQYFSLNFWWQVLAEQGIIGLAGFALPLVYLAIDWGRRFRKTGRIAILRPLVWMVPILLVMMPFSFFDNTYSLSGIALTLLSVAALSTAAMPVHVAAGDSV